jgi:hypothetical protein
LADKGRLRFEAKVLAHRLASSQITRLDDSSTAKGCQAFLFVFCSHESLRQEGLLDMHSEYLTLA